MLTRIVVGIIFALVYLTFLLILPPVGLACGIAFVVAMAAYELLRATKAANHRDMYQTAVFAAIVIPLGYFAGMGDAVVRLAVLAVMIGLFFTAIRHYDSGESTVKYEQIFTCLFAGVLIPYCLSSLVVLRCMENGRFLVLLPVICANLTDVGAYFVGMFLGKHRGITKVSPNKSLEGYIGGILFGCLIMMLYGAVLQNFANLTVSMPVLALYGLVGSAVTELGDLSFSLIKRQHGVKDYGSLMPGHGGMMDRFDSTVFAAPTILMLVEWLPAF